MIIKSEISDSNILKSILFVIIISSFLIRIKGIFFGYPLSTNIDEKFLIYPALNILAKGDLNPHMFNYGSLNIYFLSAIYFFANIILKNVLNFPNVDIPIIYYHIIGRVFIVFLSTATIYITYKIGKTLFNDIVGLVAACLIGFSYLHIHKSYTVTVDNTVTFWVSLTSLMAVLIYTQGRKPLFYIMGGIFCGLAIGSKYTAFISVFFLVIAHIITQPKDKRWIDKNILLCLFLIPVTFLITTPFAILDFKTFYSAVFNQYQHYNTSHPGHESPTQTGYWLYGKYIVTQGYGLIPSILAFLGLGWLIVKSKAKACLIAIVPMLLFIFVASHKIIFPRNLLPAFPFLSILSAVAIWRIYLFLNDHAFSKLKSTKKTIICHSLIGLLTFAIILPQAHHSNNVINIQNLPNTRWKSLMWINDGNLPDHSSIGREYSAPPVERLSQFKGRDFGFPSILKNGNVIYTLDYYVLSSSYYQRYFDQPEMYPLEVEIYSEFFDNNELVYEIESNNKTVSGPKISVYKINKDFPLGHPIKTSNIKFY